MCPLSAMQSIACRTTGQQVLGPPAVIPPEPDPGPLRDRHSPQHARRLGGDSRLPPRPRSRPACRAPERIGQAVHALPADCCAIACRVIDETTAPVLDPGRGRTKTGYLWALARDDRGWGGVAPEVRLRRNDPPGVVFTFTPGRAGQNAEPILQGFDGILQLPSRQHPADAPAG